MKKLILLCAVGLALSATASESPVKDAGGLASINNEAFAQVNPSFEVMIVSAPELLAYEVTLITAEPFSYGKQITTPANATARLASLFELIDPGRLCNGDNETPLVYVISHNHTYSARPLRPPVADQVHHKRIRLPSFIC